MKNVHVDLTKGGVKHRLIVPEDIYDAYDFRLSFDGNVYLIKREVGRKMEAFLNEERVGEYFVSNQPVEDNPWVVRRRVAGGGSDFIGSFYFQSIAEDVAALLNAKDGVDSASEGKDTDEVKERFFLHTILGYSTNFYLVKENLDFGKTQKELFRSPNVTAAEDVLTMLKTHFINERTDYGS